MNRRGFFKALVATAVVATATQTRLGQTALRLVEGPRDFTTAGMRYAAYLAKSMAETKETLAANILSGAFMGGRYES